MLRKVNIKDILKNNPQIEIEKLREIEKMYKALDRSGLKKREYRLATPITQKRVCVDDDALRDSRTTNLHHI